MTKTCCIYLRCSTAEQTVENQRGEVVQLARARGYEITHVYEENASAAGPRREFDRMMHDAHRGQWGGSGPPSSVGPSTGSVDP